MRSTLAGCPVAIPSIPASHGASGEIGRARAKKLARRPRCATPLGARLGLAGCPVSTAAQEVQDLRVLEGFPVGYYGMGSTMPAPV